MPDALAATPAFAPNPVADSADGPRRRHRPRPRTQDEPRSQGQGSRAVTPAPESSNNAEGASRPRRPRAPRPTQGHGGEQTSTHPDGPGLNAGRPGGRRRGRNGDGGVPGGQDSSSTAGSSRPRQPKSRREGQVEPSESTVPSGGSTQTRLGTQHMSKNGPRRAQRFNNKLTEEGAPGDAQNSSSVVKYRNSAPIADDLTSRLTAELSTPPYPDCLICFAPITPMQPTWSCSPSNPTLAATDDESGAQGSAQGADANAQCCWMTFHVKCIRPWASKSVKDVEEAWRARGEERQGDWRCPGCQSKRAAIPSSYW